jgi:hypothetical protein
MARFMDTANWVTVPEPSLVTKAHPVNVSAVPSFGAPTANAKPQPRTDYAGTFGILPDRPPQTKGIRPDRPKSEDR